MGEQTTDKKALNIKQFTIFFWGAWLRLFMQRHLLLYVFYDSLVEHCNVQISNWVISLRFWYR